MKAKYYKLQFLGLILLSATMVFNTSCEEEVNENYQVDAANPEFLHRSMKRLTDVIVHDIFSPPVASRIYSYPSIAAYEILALNDPNYQSLSGQIKHLGAIPKPKADYEYCHALASVHAFLTVGKKLIFSEEKIESFQEEIYQEFKDIKIPKQAYENSITYGDAVAKYIIEWASQDNYNQTRTFPKFDVNLDDDTRWQPTPPDYMEGIEPHWNKIRPFVLDSAKQFQPDFPTQYSMDKNSTFYKELMEVYDTGVNLDTAQEAIAKFWDCNPYVSNHHAHLMFATKKITPGGHWINITSIATRQKKSSLIQSAEAYTMVSISLMDAFISCWDEKYRSNLIRPETVINKFIDEDWKPLLQTPPFPEYTSGHSVISSAAAVTLTKLYGDNFAFLDTSEEEYGLPPRYFNSFIEASEEAAISRLYGGIHYMPAIDNGVTQGRRLGRFILGRVVTRKG